MDVDRVTEFTTELFGLLLRQGTAGNHYRDSVSTLGQEFNYVTARSLPSNACSTLTASLALVSKYGMFPLDWQKVMARFDEIIRLFSSTSILLPITTCVDNQY